MGIKKYFKIAGWSILLILTITSRSWGMGFSDFLQAGAAYLTHITAHEMGHNTMAYMSGGENVHLDFFKQQGGSLFVGVASADGIEPESVLPFRAAGLVASNHTYNVALASYRTQPTTYNKALLFFSGTDFLWYSVWSFYIKGSDDPSYDPVGISQETGLSPDAIVGIALAQTALNAFRAYSGDDTYTPYLSVDRNLLKAGVRVTF